MYQRILVAVDDSDGSWQALGEAIRMGGEGARLRVVTVAGNPRWSIPMGQNELYDEELMRRTLLASSQALLNRIRQEMAVRGQSVETHLLDLTRQQGNSIPEAVLTEADTWGADLIVLGTHGRRGFRRLLLGSVAEHIVRMANRPVLLVREHPEGGGECLPEELGGYHGRLFTGWPESEHLG